MKQGITEWKWYNSKYEAPEKSKRETGAAGAARATGTSGATGAAGATGVELKYTRMNRKDLKSVRRDTVQLHQNPYFANHNYIDDLKNEDLFLRPKNSHHEKSI